jgi:hypothetical protein
MMEDRKRESVKRTDSEKGRVYGGRVRGIAIVEAYVSTIVPWLA